MRCIKTFRSRNDLVELYTPLRAVGQSDVLLPKFSGPYRMTGEVMPVTFRWVMGVITPVTNELQDVNSLQKIKNKHM